MATILKLTDRKPNKQYYESETARQNEALSIKHKLLVDLYQALKHKYISRHFEFLLYLYYFNIFYQYIQPTPYFHTLYIPNS